MAKKGQFNRNAKPRSVAQRKYNSTPEQKQRRAQRNAARRQAQADGRVSKGDGKDVHHPTAKASGPLPKKTAVLAKSKNRSQNRSKGKGSK